MNAFEISWVWKDIDGPFTIYFPWKITEVYEPNCKIVKALFKAYSLDHAKEQIYLSYKTRPENINFISVDCYDSNWNPFKGAYVEQEWTIWN